MLLSSLDIAVNVALPDITAGFGADQLTIQWIILLYMGGSTSLQLGLGAAADLYGLRRFYIFGLAAYGVATFLIGLAPTLPLVFALRLFQAVGNALIMASAPALVTAIFPAERRGGALGVMAGIATLGMISAALGGGALVDAFGWRAIFLARAPIVLIAIALALTLLPGVGGAPDARERRFDLRGAALAFVCLSALALFLTLGGRVGWLSPLVIALAATALATLALLLRCERRAAHPVLDPALLRHPLLAPVLAASFLMFMAQFVNLFILPFYVSDVLRVNAKSLGFLLMLSPALAAVAAPVGGWLSDRMPAAYITTLAMVIIRRRAALVQRAHRRVRRPRCGAANGACGHRDGLVPGVKRHAHNGRDARAQAWQRRRAGRHIAQPRHGNQRSPNERPIRRPPGLPRRRPPRNASLRARLHRHLPHSRRPRRARRRALHELLAPSAGLAAAPARPMSRAGLRRNESLIQP